MSEEFIVGKKPPLHTSQLMVLQPPQALQVCPMPVLCSTIFEWEARYIADHLRPAERREIAAAQPQDPLTVILQSVKASAPRVSVYRLPARRVISAREEALPWEPAMVFGVAPWPGLPSKGIPWMLGTKRFDERQIHLLRFAKQMLGMMQGQFAALENHVHAENARAIRFIEWLGFTVEDAAPWGWKGEMFRRFHWEANPDV